MRGKLDFITKDPFEFEDIVMQHMCAEGLNLVAGTYFSKVRHGYEKLGNPSRIVGLQVIGNYFKFTDTDKLFIDDFKKEDSVVLAIKPPNGFPTYDLVLVLTNKECGVIVLGIQIST